MNKNHTIKYIVGIIFSPMILFLLCLIFSSVDVLVKCNNTVTKLKEQPHGHIIQRIIVGTKYF